ncbi:polymeric immunoglobulin receptor-like isoform X2 [Anarhichas minor]|uniref:polymeric immunoglobulin receptor-like isoform X2 n=1 Tax=Anarhichas minor TaxID=65739 RepID=UPI003F73DD52
MRMWSLEKLLFSLCIALSCVSSAAGSIHVSGYEGGHVKVSCPYSEGYEPYEKYLCKNDCGDDDVLIKTTEPNKTKYSIHDDDQKRVFTATISDLSRTDAGKYWCGVTRTGKDIYTEVDLEVGQDSCCERSTKFRSHEESSVSISCPYESQSQNNLKYICRGNQPSTCLEKAIITSDNHQTGQFRLTDDKVSREFTVTITGLTQNNSGSYLCGVHGSTGLDVFSAFELEVKEWCCVRSNKLSGIVGRPVTMQCPYSPKHSDNRKFLCKGDHRNNCTEMVTKQSRFTLQEDVSSSSFLVIVTELKAEDAGTYWCGSDSQWSVGNYTKIQLSAVFPQQTSTEISSTSTEIFTEIFTVVEQVGSQSTLIPGKRIKAISHFVVFTVLAVLLTLVFALVIVYKYKCNKVQGAGANVNRGKAVETEEGIAVSDIYENQDVVCSKQDSSKPKSACQHDDGDDDASETQQECVYQNYTSTEDIYTNQTQIEANRR